MKSSDTPRSSLAKSNRKETAGGVVDGIFDAILNPRPRVETYTSDYSMTTYRKLIRPMWGKYSESNKNERCAHTRR